MRTKFGGGTSEVTKATETINHLQSAGNYLLSVVTDNCVLSFKVSTYGYTFRIKDGVEVDANSYNNATVTQPELHIIKSNGNFYLQWNGSSGEYSAFIVCYQFS